MLLQRVPVLLDFSTFKNFDLQPKYRHMVGERIILCSGRSRLQGNFGALGKFSEENKHEYKKCILAGYVRRLQTIIITDPRGSQEATPHTHPC